MSDIYKQRPEIPAEKTVNRRRRRRSAADGTFDETKTRRRRSRNSGLRRLLHLFRKEENEKRIWISALVVALVVLVIVGIWQFWYLEQQARQRAREQEMYQQPRGIPRHRRCTGEPDRSVLRGRHVLHLWEACSRGEVGGCRCPRWGRSRCAHQP